MKLLDVAGGSRRPRRSFASASLLMLVMAVSASLLPSRPAKAAENLVQILTGLQVEYGAARNQLLAVISANSVGGKVELQLTRPALDLYRAATITANVKLQTLTSAGLVNTLVVANLLTTDINAVGTGAWTVLQVTPPIQVETAMEIIQELEIHVLMLMRNVVRLVPMSKVMTCSALNVHTLQVFPRIRVTCGR